MGGVKEVITALSATLIASSVPEDPSLIRALRKAGSKDSKPGDVLKHVSTHSFLRKPADRLGKVVLANEVSIGGLGGGRCRVGHGARN